MRYSLVADPFGRFAFLLCSLLWVGIFTSVMQAATPAPLIRYSFNKSEDETSAIDETGHGRDAVFISAEGSGSTIPKLAGISGLALDLESASGMGLGSTGSKIQFSGRRDMSLGTLISFTILFWMKASEELGKSAQLFSTSATTDPLVLGLPKDQPRIYFQIGAETVIFKLSQPLDPNEWILVALVYDSLSASEQARLYVGRKSSGELESAGAKPLPHGAWNAEPSREPWGFAIGNTTLPESDRPFKGLIDEFRLFGSDADASGALSQEEIKRIFLKDLGR